MRAGAWAQCVHLDQPQGTEQIGAGRIESRIAEHDEVMECYLMTGDSDYLIRVVVADIQALEKFILEQLSPIPGIEKSDQASR